MNDTEKKMCGEAMYKLYLALDKKEQEEKNAQQREEMFKEFGREG